MLAKLKQITNHSGFKKYFFNTSWGLIEKVFSIFSSVLVGIWVARYLEPEGYGVIGYASSLVGILMAFSTLGLNKILVRNLVKNKTERESLLGTSLFLQTMGSVFIMLVLSAYVMIADDSDLVKKVVIILGLRTFFQSFQIVDSYFQSEVKVKFVAMTNIITLGIIGVIKITLILIEAPLLYFVYAMVLETVLAGFGFLYFYQRYTKKSFFSWKVDFTKAKELLRDSWPLILNGIIVSVYMRIDQVMLKNFIDEEAVGLYAAAARLSEAFYFLPVVVTSSLYPAIVNAKKKDNDLYYARLQSLYNLMVWCALFIVIPIVFLNDFIINLLYGQDYAPAGEVLALHAWTGIFVFLGVARGGWVITENLQRYSSLYLSCGMIANVVLNVFLIPKYGIMGAAFATLVSQGVSVWIAPLFFKPTRVCFYMITKALLLYPFIINLLSKDEKKAF